MAVNSPHRLATPALRSGQQRGGQLSIMAKVAPNVPDCENNSTPE